MRKINLQTWPRREHFEFFQKYDHPHFSIGANVDVTEVVRGAKLSEATLTTAICYILARSANEIPEFRQRIRGREVVEHEVVHPAITILTPDDLFSFCIIEYKRDFEKFCARAVKEVDSAKVNSSLDEGPYTDEMLFMTSIPWVSFTSFRHPMNLDPPDSVPRFAWGKIFEDGGRLKMPLDVQLHHGLADGLHTGRYFAKVEELASRPLFLQAVT